MMIKIPIRLIIISGFLSSCNSDDGLRAEARIYAEAICEEIFAFDCGYAWARTYEECVGGIIDDWTSRIDEYPELTFNRKCLDHRISILPYWAGTQWSSIGPFEWNSASCDVFNGTHGLLETCTILLDGFNECSPGLVCAAEDGDLFTLKGRCVSLASLPKELDACAWDKIGKAACAPGLACEQYSKICKPTLKEEDLCEPYGDVICANSWCTPRGACQGLTPDGQPCMGPDECEGYCSFDIENRTCQPALDGVLACNGLRSF